MPTISERLRSEIQKVIIGQEDLIEMMTIALLCRGHVLLIGPPGMAKTTLVQSFAQALSLPFNRIQFTPDLMPSDILGTEILEENRSTGARELRFVKGPIFTQILLADEINRTPPKTQSALLQAMQERTVTLFGRTEKLVEPFMVLATQNPLEQEGTYPLPEAQLDRFLFALNLTYPSLEQEKAILKKHASRLNAHIEPVLHAEEILTLQGKVLDMSVSEHIYDLALRFTRSTRPGENDSPAEIKRYVKWGAGPRATQFLILACKARALLHGRPTPIEEDIRALFLPCMNHRILLNFEAEAENRDVNSLMKNILN